MGRYVTRREKKYVVRRMIGVEVHLRRRKVTPKRRCMACSAMDDIKDNRLTGKKMYN